MKLFSSFMYMTKGCTDLILNMITDQFNKVNAFFSKVNAYFLI